MRNSYLTVTDQFCGAGGSSLGALAAGLEIRLALNHWQLAIDTHAANFPKVDHVCEDISAVDPRRYASTDILITSPECFPAGTLILTARGLVPIEEVLAGELVLTHLGRWRRVTRTQGRTGSTVRVRGQGHTEGIEVTPNHRFYARPQGRLWNNAIRRYERTFGAADWTPADGLTTGTHRWATPVSVDPLLEPVPPLTLGTDLASAWWLIGRWLGDGSLSFGRNHETVISCGRHKIDDLDRRLKATGARWSRYEKRTAVNYTLGDRDTRDFFLETFGRGAAGKTLPASVLGMPAELRAALLAGYVSSDGYTGTRRTQCMTVSRRLALGIRLLAESLGNRCGLQRYAQHTNVIEGRTVKVQDLWLASWENNASSRAAFVEGKHAWSLIKAIEPGRARVEVFNLEVEEDHSYVAEGIVVANCTNHSLAKGAKRRALNQGDLFDSRPTDPSVERSRATMWDVVRFAELHRYRIVIVENVVDVRHWLLWDAWLQAMEVLGYRHRLVSLNSMHCHPTPQSRDRAYVVFWRRGNRAPNLDVRPQAPCPRCGEVEAVQTWKRNSRTGSPNDAGRYKRQYVFTCPTCRAEVVPYYYAALNAIDWTLAATRIGDRPKALKPRTRERIRYGLDKYGRMALLVTTNMTTDKGRVRAVFEPGFTQTGSSINGLVSPFIINTRHISGTGHRVKSAVDPLGVVTGSGVDFGVAAPFLFATSHPNGNGSYVRSVGDPLPTQTSAQELGLVMPFLSCAGSRETAPSGGDEPIPTLTGSERLGVTFPPFLVTLRTHSREDGLNEPLRTVCAEGNHHGLIQGAALLTMRDHPTFQFGEVADPLFTQTAQQQAAVISKRPFLVQYYGTGTATPADQGIPAITSVDRHALVEPSEELSVDDCYFRMLQPHELQAGMAFPSDYKVLGNQREKVKQIGNAVTPPAMAWLIQRCVESLHPEVAR